MIALYIVSAIIWIRAFRITAAVITPCFLRVVVDVFVWDKCIALLNAHNSLILDLITPRDQSSKNIAFLDF